MKSLLHYVSQFPGPLREYAFSKISPKWHYRKEPSITFAALYLKNTSVTEPDRQLWQNVYQHYRSGHPLPTAPYTHIEENEKKPIKYKIYKSNLAAVKHAVTQIEDPFSYVEIEEYLTDVGYEIATIDVSRSLSSLKYKKKIALYDITTVLGHFTNRYQKINHESKK